MDDNFLPLMARSSGHLMNLNCVNIMALPTHPLSDRGIPSYASGGINESEHSHFAGCRDRTLTAEQTQLATQCSPPSRITPLRLFCSADPLLTLNQQEVTATGCCPPAKIWRQKRQPAMAQVTDC